MTRAKVSGLSGLLLLAGLVLVLINTTRATAAGELASVTVSPASTTVAQGGSVAVPVVIQSIGGVTVTGFQASMTYDSTKLSVASCQTGVGAGANCQTGTVGTVGIGAAPALANGASITVVTVNFNANAAGVSPLTITVCNASDENFNETGCVITNSSITVQAPATTVTTVPTTVTAVPTTVTPSPTTPVPSATTAVPTTVVPTTVVPPSPGVIRFAQSTSSVSESQAGPQAVTVRRVGGNAGDATAICTVTVLGTASIGQDFTATVSQNLFWSDGDSSNRTCDWTLLQDNTVEGPETIIFSLSDGDINETLRATIGNPDTHVVTINDDDTVVSPNTPTATSTPPTIAQPPRPTNTPYPTSTPTITNTPKPTDTAVPTNTSSAQTHTPTATNTKPAGTSSPSVSATTPSGTGGTGATPRPPSAGTGNSFGGTNTLAALLLVAIGLGISGFAATRVTRKP